MLADLTEKKAEAVLNEAERLVREIVELLESRLGVDSKLEIVAKVEVDLDWPYTLTVETEASSRSYPRRDLEETINKVVDEALERASQRLKAQGLEVLP
uniref:DUF3194 domain-containing protein n=1 Tax=Thermofilum pendens TaxID=2269 RepID=A0A7C1T163_THEPE